MRFVVLDGETYFDDEYTLHKMTTEAYIRDPRFELNCVGIKWDANTLPRSYDEREFRYLAKYEDWSDVILCCHHSQFDGLYLNHHYGIRPAKWTCTLSMARLILGNHLGVSLDAVRKHYGMPPKITPYDLFKGKRWATIPHSIQEQIKAGCCDEVESIWTLFGQLYKQFPQSEYEIVDATIRMFTEPVLRADVDILAKVWEEENDKKAGSLERLGITSTMVQSSDTFADLLRVRGVEPEMKESPKGNVIYAFAKTDDFMRDLLEDEDDEIRALAEARIGAKSTQLQTRAETFGRMAQRGAMCVYLRLYGAHSTRWSGGDKANWQNLKRTDPDNDKVASPLRRSILAPEGFLLGAPDLSQIECRLLEYLAGEWDAIEEFRRGDDPYIALASEFYGCVVTKADKPKRGTGKQIRLSCGYGSGALKFQQTLKLGTYGPPVHLDLSDCQRAVDLYRDQRPGVTRYWKTAGQMIPRLAAGETIEWGPMLIKDKLIYGPGGTFIDYTTLEYHRPTQEEIEKRKLAHFKWNGFWRYKTRNGWQELYHTKLVAETTQWLACVIIKEKMSRLLSMGYRILNTTHDELLVLIPKDGNEKRHRQIILEVMKETPYWLPGIPLEAECDLGERYEK